MVSSKVQILQALVQAKIDKQEIAPTNPVDSNPSAPHTSQQEEDDGDDSWRFGFGFWKQFSDVRMKFADKTKLQFWCRPASSKHDQNNLGMMITVFRISPHQRTSVDQKGEDVNNERRNTTTISTSHQIKSKQFIINETPWYHRPVQQPQQHQQRSTMGIAGNAIRQQPRSAKTISPTAIYTLQRHFNRQSTQFGWSIQMRGLRGRITKSRFTVGEIMNDFCCCLRKLPETDQHSSSRYIGVQYYRDYRAPSLIVSGGTCQPSPTTKSPSAKAGSREVWLNMSHDQQQRVQALKQTRNVSDSGGNKQRVRLLKQQAKNGNSGDTATTQGFILSYHKPIPPNVRITGPNVPTTRISPIDAPTAGTHPNSLDTLHWCLRVAYHVPMRRHDEAPPPHVPLSDHFQCPQLHWRDTSSLAPPLQSVAQLLNPSGSAHQQTPRPIGSTYELPGVFPRG
eukprot:jgi/Psemu1/11242/gm1.11242_g